jgi:hypothetical protein
MRGRVCGVGCIGCLGGPTLKICFSGEGSLSATHIHVFGVGERRVEHPEGVELAEGSLAANPVAKGRGALPDLRGERGGRKGVSSRGQ